MKIKSTFMILLITTLKKLSFLVVISFFFFLISCNHKEETNLETDVNYNFIPYDLMNPDTIFYLPNKLNEISGISVYSDNKIACIQDEKGTIFIFDSKNGKVISDFDFGKNGDYEDISIVGKDAYVLRSDGTIFQVLNFENKLKKQTVKIKTPLSSKNNAEGLFFFSKTNSLLIGCKASPSINDNDNYPGFKAIYRYDLKKKGLITKPEYLIKLSLISEAENGGNIKKFYIEILNKLNILKADDNFHPSAIALHPYDDTQIYIISAVEKLLIVMNQKGGIMELFQLDKDIFPHPEGISFSDNGDLYISNEGRNSKGNIVKYRYLKK